MSIKVFIISRLKEPSTWRWLIIASTFFGAQFSPEQQEAIISAGVAIAAAVGILVPDILPGNSTMQDASRISETENSAKSGYDVLNS